MDEIKKLMELAGIDVSNKDRLDEKVIGDMQNGYDRQHKTTTYHSDYFPSGADSNAVDHTLPNGQGQNDNPMQKTIKDGKRDDISESEDIHRDLVYKYRAFMESSEENYGWDDEDDSYDEEPNELPDDLVKQIEDIAQSEYDAGGRVEINHGLPYVAVNTSSGEEYFFQGEEAERLLDEVPYNVNEEDYILYSSTNW